MRKSPVLIAALFVALALAGCTNGPGGQSVSGKDSLAYNGASSGDQSTEVRCGGRGDVEFAANIGSGSVTFTVKDDSGDNVYRRTISGPGQSAREDTVTGVGGTWRLTADRSSGFSGQYTIHLDC